MDYKEKYEQALEKARELMNKGYDVLMPELFPELNENEDEKIKREIVAYINELADLKNEKIPTKWLAWLEEQKDYIKLPNSAYTSNKDVIEFADTYSHDVWEKLMDNFKKIENYHIGCNDVSDIVLNAIINTYNWLEKQDEKCNTNNVLPSLGNSQVQDILEDIGMLDDNGHCPHTAEEIFKAGMEYQYNLKHKAVSSVMLNADTLTKVLTKHLYTCVNKTNTYVRSEEDHITLSELIAKIKVDLNIK